LTYFTVLLAMHGQCSECLAWTRSPAILVRQKITTQMWLTTCFVINIFFSVTMMKECYRRTEERYNNSQERNIGHSVQYLFRGLNKDKHPVQAQVVITERYESFLYKKSFSSQSHSVIWNNFSLQFEKKKKKELQLLLD